MNWMWPDFLLLLGLVPLFTGVYVWMLRRKRRYPVRYSSLTLVRDALPRVSPFKRHFPFALFLLAITSLIIALGRPTTTTTVPAGRATVMLAMDVSRSMLQTDISPSRLRAAELAALSFIQSRVNQTQIGIVVFAGYAQLVLPPTTDQEALTTVIDSLTTGRGTAIGAGIIESLNAIAEINENVTPVDLHNPNEPEPVPNGMYEPDVIVVLTDGVTTTGPDPLAAAQFAANRGVRVYTIGFGTETGSPTLEGGMFGGGTGFRRGIDEATLIAIAEITGGEYYAAGSASELQNVFRELPSNLIMREEMLEISVLFAAMAAYLVIMAVGLALVWNPMGGSS
jgi:Ca-activated chloride channel homolog